MTNQQIKDELRRSACEDDDPSGGLKQYAWEYQMKWRPNVGYERAFKSIAAVRFFFLLVAEALE